VDRRYSLIEITGKYNSARVFTGQLDEASRGQIQQLCDLSFSRGSVIRLMPDVHTGAGCTIGTTMTIADKVVPNMVGVDIGCGMETVIIKADTRAAKEFDPVALDRIIHAQIPSGMDIRDDPLEADPLMAAGTGIMDMIDLAALRCPVVNRERARRSIGTLGGGNHFIEANRDEENNLYLVIHSGSRHLGIEVAEYYQEEAWRQLNENGKADIAALIARYKREGRQREIQSRLAEIRTQVITDVPRELAYVSGGIFDDYIHDMRLTQAFALVNRRSMMTIIMQGLGLGPEDIHERFSTIHNYIDTESMILRKGAVSAKAGEKLIIPMNMRDGSIIAEGLGNPDWNYSAPHGAGRVMSRKKAFAVLTMKEYEREMRGVYSTSVNERTIDESPMAYKPMDDILANMAPTAKILAVVKPLYNFKAAEEEPAWKKARGKEGDSKDAPHI